MVRGQRFSSINPGVAKKAQAPNTPNRTIRTQRKLRWIEKPPDGNGSKLPKRLKATAITNKKQKKSPKRRRSA
ncbi:MAG TPA: hypothetical protein DEF79_12410 [Gammaproteobacteria bacterium]|nr:hypothetical protein [Gammaproteobacteria bacterium]|tara:strand:- start:737 stop:955 length:219 start_codon:yes stop_codon:yes gene_type:complete